MHCISVFLLKLGTKSFFESYYMFLLVQELAKFSFFPGRKLVHLYTYRIKIKFIGEIGEMSNVCVSIS